MAAAAGSKSLEGATEDVYAAVKKIATAVFEKELNLRKQFKRWDKDGSGGLDKDELTDALSDLGMKLTPAQANSVVRKYAPSGADELTREQFLKCVDDLQAMQSAASPRGTPLQSV